MPINQQQQQQRRRRPRTRYGQQMEEKQQLKAIFGVREEQLRRYYKLSRKSRAETGPALIAFLEKRLDNAIFRAGFAETRPQARQMASHRLFTVNGRAVNIPSYQVRVGDVIGIKESKRGKNLFLNFEKRTQNMRPPSWIEIQNQDFAFKIVGEPTVQEAGLGVDIRAVVEMFAR